MRAFRDRPSRNRLIAGSVIVAIGIIGCIALIALRSNGTDDQDDTATTTTTTVAIPEAADGAGNDDSLVLADPVDDDIAFEQVGTSWYPISDADGPTVFTDERSTGFAQTPDGAALAGIHIYTRWNPDQNPNGWEATIDEQVRGVGQEPLRELGERVLSNRTDDPDTSNQAPIGWTVTAFNPLEANVDTYWLSQTNGRETTAALSMRLVWEDDDWRLVVPDSGHYRGHSKFVILIEDPPERDLSEAFE